MRGTIRPAKAMAMTMPVMIENTMIERSTPLLYPPRFVLS